MGHGRPIDSAAYGDGRRHHVDPDTMTIDDPVVGDGLAWLGSQMPDEAELQRAMVALGITGVSATEVLTPHARPVLTVDGSVVQLVLRTAAYEDRSKESTSSYLAGALDGASTDDADGSDLASDPAGFEPIVTNLLALATSS